MPSRSHRRAFTVLLLSALAAAPLPAQINLNPSSAPSTTTTATAAAPSGNAEQRVLALTQQASEKLQAKDANAALKCLQEALELAKKECGENSEPVSQVCLNIGAIFKSAARYQDALSWVAKAVLTYENRGATQSSAYGIALQALGERYLSTAENLRALDCFERSHKILIRFLQEKDPALITSYHDLGVGYQMLGHQSQARENLEKALALREEVIGKDSIPVGYTAWQLGKTYISTNNFDFAKAEPLMLRAEQIMVAHQKEDPTIAARTVGELVNLYTKHSEFTKAESYLKQTEELLKEFFPPDHPSYTGYYLQLATLREEENRPSEAEPAYLKYLEFAEKTNKNGAAAAGACMALGVFYERAGLTVKAEEYLHDGLKRAIAANGPESGQTTEGCLRLTRFYYYTTKNMLQAEEYARQGSEAFYRASGRKFRLPEFELLRAYIANALGKKAESIRVLLEMKAEFERFGVKETAMSAYHSAMIFLAELNGRQDQALKDIIEDNLTALRAYQKIHPQGEPEHPDIVIRLRSLAECYQLSGQPGEAAVHIDRAMGILRKQVAPSQENYKKALELLIANQVDLKRPVTEELFAEHMEVEMARAREMLAMPNSEERLQWGLSEWPFDVSCTLGNARDAALLSLRTKDLTQDVEVENRRLATAALTPEGRPLWEKYGELRSQYIEAIRTPTSRANLASLSDAMIGAEKEICKLAKTHSQARQNLDLTLRQIQDTLPADAALLDYVSYSHRDPGGDQEMRYAIILQRKGHEPKLFDAKYNHEQVDYLIRLFRQAMGTPGKDPKKKNEALALLLTSMGECILGPVEAELEGVKTLIISPDWELQTLPFATLLDKQGKFYGERFRVQYVTTARDLLRKSPPFEPGKTGSLAFFAGAKYRLGISILAATRASSYERARAADLLQNRSGVAFVPPVPGTEREMALVHDVARDAGWRTDMYRAERATEAALRAISPAPQVLHVATHGYYFPHERDKPAVDEVWPQKIITKAPGHGGHRAIYTNPERSGILFAGAEDTINFWERGYVMPSKNDGFLNSEEASQLDLTGTQLVVLSACETGVGEAIPNGGIASLRSAFQSAGAQHVISTLWSIYDGQSADLMAEFYKRLFATGKVGQSLSQTQREWLVRLRQEKGLWQAIKQAGGFILTSSGSEE